MEVSDLDRPRDAFLSYASVDSQYVFMLAEALTRLGATVWYDEFELKPGDSIVASLDKGLAESRFGLLLITPAFLGRPWTEYERVGLINRQVSEGQVVVVPIWLGVGHADVAKLSPTLADQKAIVADPDDPLEAAVKALTVVRPELAQAYLRRLFLNAELEGGPEGIVQLSELEQEAPVRYEKLPRSLLLRIAVVHEVFADVFDVPWEQTMLNFRRDLRPDREVAIWEMMAAAYTSVARAFADQRSDVSSAVLTRSTGDYGDLNQTAIGRAVIESYERLERAIAAYASDEDQPLDGPVVVGES